MKTNEIISEGPLDFAKKFQAGVSGAVQGFQASQQQRQGQQEVNTVASTVIQQWNKLVGQYQQAGRAITVDQLVAFVKQKASTANVTPPADLTNQVAIKDYIVKSIAQHLINNQPQSNQQSAQTQDQPQPAVDVQQPAKPSGNQMAAELKADWDAFTQSGGSAGPAVKQQLKQMWLDAGGIRAESKKNKKKSV